MIAEKLERVVILAGNQRLCSTVMYDDHFTAVCIIQCIPFKYGFGVNLLMRGGGIHGISLWPPALNINEGGRHFSLRISPFTRLPFNFCIHLGNWRDGNKKYALWFSFHPFSKLVKSGFWRSPSHTPECFDRNNGCICGAVPNPTYNPTSAS